MHGLPPGCHNLLLLRPSCMADRRLAGPVPPHHCCRRCATPGSAREASTCCWRWRCTCWLRRPWCGVLCLHLPCHNAAPKLACSPIQALAAAAVLWRARSEWLHGMLPCPPVQALVLEVGEAWNGWDQWAQHFIQRQAATAAGAAGAAAAAAAGPRAHEQQRRRGVGHVRSRVARRRSCGTLPLTPLPAGPLAGGTEPCRMTICRAPPR